MGNNKEHPTRYTRCTIVVQLIRVTNIEWTGVWGLMEVPMLKEAMTDVMRGKKPKGRP